ELGDPRRVARRLMGLASERLELEWPPLAPGTARRSRGHVRGCALLGNRVPLAAGLALALPAAVDRAAVLTNERGRAASPGKASDAIFAGKAPPRICQHLVADG